MSALITTIACVLSLCAIRTMMRGDAKRMRVVGGTAMEPTRRIVWLSRVLLWGPGIVLAALGDAAGFVIWLGALTAFGWAMVAMPHLTLAATLPIRRYVDDARYWALGRYVAVRRIIEMPSRIAELEQEVADMRRELDALRAEREDRAA
ncbi:MAG: hypothetical protein AAGD13_10400 [Pseudomonadota bacterium]